MHSFYRKKGKILLKDVLDYLKIPLAGFDGSLEIHDISPIEKSKKGHLTFLIYNPISGNKYIEMIQNAEVNFCLVDKRNSDKLSSEIIKIEVENPYLSFIKLYAFFYEKVHFESYISPSAVIHPTAFVGKNCEIGDNVVIGASAVIEECVKIQKNCIISPNASLKFCIIGEGTHIGYGARIGQDGFGYISEKKDDSNSIIKIPHFGGVEIGENCSIGANTCVDRGNFDNTQIGSFVKIDNLCQIAHNVRIGNCTMMAGQAGIAGSTKIGNNVLIGAKAGIIGHIKVGDNAIIYASASITKSVPEKARMLGGWPADFYDVWIRKLTFFSVAYKRVIKFKNFLDKSNSFKAKILRFLIKKF